MRRTYFRAAGAIAFLMSSGFALRAQTAPARPNMAEAVSYALRSNPDVITARLQADSARGEQRIAKALPNPTFAVAPGNPFQYAINQPIDVGPDRIYRMRAANQGTAAVRLDVQNATRQVVFAVRQGFLDLLLAEAVRGIAFEQDTIVLRLLQSDSLRFLEGDLARLDLNTTELQSAHADANLARADATTRAARINLQVLMGVPHPDTSFRVNGALEYRPFELPFDSLRSLSMAERPDIAAAQERVDQSRSLRSLANSLLLPVPGLAGVYQHEPFASGSKYALGVSLSVPILYWFGGERERATAGLRSAEIARQRAVSQAESDVVGAADSFRAARTLAARYASGLLERSRATLEMQRFAYEHGNASLLDLLNAISAFGDTQTDYYTAVHDYWVAVYAIDRAVGRDLVP
jgi:cobalt-zinc-cadmium efflux system outer membrane protein